MQEVVDSVFQEIEYELIRGNDIQIRNFGTFRTTRVYGGSEFGGMKLVANDQYRVKFQVSEKFREKAIDYFKYKEVYDHIND